MRGKTPWSFGGRRGLSSKLDALSQFSAALLHYWRRLTLVGTVDVSTTGSCEHSSYLLTWRGPSCRPPRPRGPGHPIPPKTDYMDSVLCGASSSPPQVGAEGHSPPRGCTVRLGPCRRAAR